MKISTIQDINSETANREIRFNIRYQKPLPAKGNLWGLVSSVENIDESTPVKWEMGNDTLRITIPGKILPLMDDYAFEHGITVRENYSNASDTEKTKIISDAIEYLQYAASYKIRTACHGLLLGYIPAQEEAVVRLEDEHNQLRTKLESILARGQDGNYQNAANTVGFTATVEIPLEHLVNRSVSAHTR